MTGPEHYLEAERLLSPVQLRNGDEQLPTQRDIETAQVHATLALAAATAAAQATKYDGDENYQRSRGWAGVA